MKKALRIFLWALLVLILLLAVAWFGFLKPEPPPISAGDRAKIELMPLPSSLKLLKGTLVLEQLPVAEYTSGSTPRMERAVERFQKRLGQRTGLMESGDAGPRLILTCGGTAAPYPACGDDESYSMKISGKDILLKATTETGILYGLESLLQLAALEEGQWMFPCLKMKDQPRYGWRGLMIDACRHWIPKDVILRNLDAMASVKMNVLHWHLTEYQAFRVESREFPKLHGMGSKGDYYTQEDIREVIEFAADRGIRVVPEFDLPGHSTAWFAGYPELASAPGPYVPDTVFGILDPVMDPTREEVYDFLDRFFGEMAALFPDVFIHIGGDEVKPDHWLENPDIVSFMNAKGMEGPHDLQAYFTIRLQKILAGHGKKMMGWDEIIHPDLPKDGIAVQTWRDQASLWESARKGNQAILSAGYYLDYKQPASYHYGVDPLAIPGAVDIEVDSSNWKSWDCTLEVSDLVIEGSLYLFGEGESLRGIVDFFEGSAGFSEAEQSGGQLSFTLDSKYGKVKFELETREDSIFGQARLSIITTNLQGHRSGGSDMEGGSPLPEFKRIEALTPEEASRILGGEACQWAEMVNGNTLESKVWPRNAAIAERLWSPAVLTSDVDDMYRRLWKVLPRLKDEGIGLRDNFYAVFKGVQQADSGPDAFLRLLAEWLQEDNFFNRMVIYKPFLTTNTPLDRMVDAVTSESRRAYFFRKEVEKWLKTGDPGILEILTADLEDIVAIADSLGPYRDDAVLMEDVGQHIDHMVELAKASLAAIEDPGYYRDHTEAIDSLLQLASKAHGGCQLKLVEPVQILMEGIQ
jgi:hexosaminidase